MQSNDNMGLTSEGLPEYSAPEAEVNSVFGGGADDFSEEGGNQDEQADAAQPEEPEKKRKTRKKKDEPDGLPEGDEGNRPFEGPGGEGSGWPPGEGEDDVEYDDADDEYADEPDYDGEAAPEPDGLLPEETGQRSVAPATRRRASQRRPAVLDSSGNVIHERGDTGQHDLSVLTGARNRRRILTATVDAIEMDGLQLPRVVFYVGTVKVMIPFSQMGFDLDPETVTQREARLLIDSMLGAIIDYMVVGVDTKERLAGASRRAAMLLRQRTILNARNTRGTDFRITEGMRVMARILHVSQHVLRVEVFGFETWLRIPDVSNIWVNDIREAVKVGEERPVEIISLRRDDQGQVTSMRVSMKAAEDAPVQQLRAGNTYTGHILNFSDKAYYVRVAGVPIDIRCPIKSNYTMELMEAGDYVKFFIPAIYDGVPTGAILKIIKKRPAAGI